MHASEYKRRRLRTRALLLVGVVSLGVSGVLLRQHIAVMAEVQTVSLPLLAQVTPLEQRLSVLEEQVEMSELQSALQVGSNGERLDTYVLPRETDYDRLLGVFDLLSETLQRSGKISAMSDITFGDPVSLGDHLTTRPLRVRFAAHREGVEDILAFLRIAGLLTVGDVLTDDEIDLLYGSTEQENPAGIVALEQFLSLDLLHYAQGSRSAEDQLKRSFSSPGFVQTLNSVTSTSLLRDARRVYEGDFGRLLSEAKLWPVQYLRAGEVELIPGSAPGWFTMALRVDVLERK